jgi:S-formylglutathione hydrolase FrmB
MGGRGALYFAYRLPSRFAAVLALSPYSPITAWANKLAQIPLWLFQGTADNSRADHRDEGASWRNPIGGRPPSV